MISLVILLAAICVCVWWIVNGASAPAPTYQPHILRVIFLNGYETEFFCNNVDDALDYLAELKDVKKAFLERYVPTPVDSTLLAVTE